MSLADDLRWLLEQGEKPQAQPAERVLIMTPQLYTDLTMGSPYLPIRLYEEELEALLEEWVRAGSVGGGA